MAATRLQEIYNNKIKKDLQSKFNYKNPMQVPRVLKVTVNMGVGETTVEAKAIDAAVADLTAITGQKPQVIKSRKAIAAFKLRQGLPVGAKVTLRSHHMYEFMDRLVTIALPRVRDFRGLNPKSFDGRGSYTFGLKEQIVFPEINYDKIDKVRGMDITITTNAKNNEETKALLEAFNFPFVGDKK
ncbi:MAG: 50S ribosomal protein L5 [Proteobacteria bacterium]|nr:50S ribosomal protein L5 [Pseudomonadota bacterium]